PGTGALPYEDCVRAWMDGTPETKVEERTQKGEKLSASGGIDVPVGKAHLSAGAEVSSEEATTRTATRSHPESAGYDARCRGLEHDYMNEVDAARDARLRKGRDRS